MGSGGNSERRREGKKITLQKARNGNKRARLRENGLKRTEKRDRQGDK